MSLTSLILAFLAPMAARFKPVDKTPLALIETPVDDKSHPRFIAGYDAGLADGRRELDKLQRERDMWRERALARPQDEQARALQQYLQPQMAQAQDGRYLQNMWAQQTQQNLALQQQMMAQAQNQQAFAYDWASCTPPRSRALTGRGA